MPADNPIKIPGNLVPVFDAVSRQTGIPMGLLAAVIQTQLGGFPNTLDDSAIARVGALLYQNAQSRDPYDTNWRPDWGTVAGAVFGGGDPGWRNRFLSIYDSSVPDSQMWVYDSNNPDPAPGSRYRTPNIGAGIGGDYVIAPGGEGGSLATYTDINDVYAMFKNSLGRNPKNDAEAERFVGMKTENAMRAIEALPEAKTYRENLNGITSVRSWANSTYQQILGRAPTNDELISIANHGWNDQQLALYLRAQPYGDTKSTIGQAVDLRDAMQKAAQTTLHRDATPEEINFAVVNNIPAANASAFYEQVRDKTVWAGDPDTYRNYRTLIQNALKANGITVRPEDIDPTLVNKAVTGKWTDQQVTDQVRAGQMPGAPTGVSIGGYTSQRDMAEQIWKTYFPNKPLDNATFNGFIGLTPQQVNEAIRALPSPDALAAGKVIPVGLYADTKGMAKSALSALGVLGRDPTAQEIAQFQGADAEAIKKFYATDPRVLAVNPGAQYGQTREDYYRNRAGVENAYARNFETPQDLSAVQAKAADPTVGAAPAESPWLKEVFKEGYTPEQSSRLFDDYFKRLGAPPSAHDIDLYKTRSTQILSANQPSQSADASVTEGPTGPKMPSLAGPSSGVR